MARKKKVFQCKKCSFNTTGPSSMHKHYVRCPSHATQSSIVMAEKRAEKRHREIAAELPLEPVPSRPRRRHGLKFCPDCGHDLQGY